MATQPADAAEPTLRGAVDRMLALRAEHKPILDKIVSDGGMAPDTRQVLVEHLWAEEEEKLGAIANLTPKAAHAGASAPQSARPVKGAGLTVGSLRPDVPPAGMFSVGSLRRP